MPQGSAPGERRGGRQKGTKNKAKVASENSLANALKFALEEAGEEKIRSMSPATLLRFAMHVAAVKGFGLAAMSFAEKCAPYFDPKLSSSQVDLTARRTVQEYTDDELLDLAAASQIGQTLLIEGSADGGESGTGSPTTGETEASQLH